MHAFSFTYIINFLMSFGACILDDLGRAVEELVTVITEQENDTIDNGNHNPTVILDDKN